MKNNQKIAWIISVLLLFFPGVLFIYLGKGKHNFSKLPIVGTMAFPKGNVLPTYVPLDSTELENKILVLEFVKEESRARHISDKLKRIPKIRIISYIAQNEVSRFEDFIKRSKADFVHWQFVAIDSAILNKELDKARVVNASNYFILYDPKGQIRGTYTDMDRKKIEEDARLLVKEYGKK